MLPIAADMAVASDPTLIVADAFGGAGRCCLWRPLLTDL